MSDGSEFQVRGAVAKNARRGRSHHVLGTVSSGALDTTKDELEQPSGSGRSSTLALRKTLSWKSSVAILYVTRCLTGSQWSDLSNGLSSVRPPRWQTTLAKLFWARCSTLKVTAGAPIPLVASVFEISCKKQIDRERQRQSNVHENSTPWLPSRCG